MQEIKWKCQKYLTIINNGALGVARKAWLSMKVRNEGIQIQVSGTLNSNQQWNFMSSQQALLSLKVRNEGNQMEVSGTSNKQ